MQIGFFGILGLLFIALKLIGVIAWSWWWVLLPLYGAALWLAVVLLAIVVAALAGGRSTRRFRR